GKKTYVMIWNYHDDDVPGPAAEITLGLNNLTSGKSLKVREYRIDADHSNAYTAWQKMGSPPQPTAEQYRQLEKAGQLAELGGGTKVTVKNGVAVLKVTLARQAVSLL